VSFHVSVFDVPEGSASFSTPSMLEAAAWTLRAVTEGATVTVSDHEGAVVVRGGHGTWHFELASLLPPPWRDRLATLLVNSGVTP
jgi:hypothetical protein